MKASRVLQILSIPVLAMLVFAIGVGGASASSPGNPSVDPVLVPGNPTCVGQGYDFGYKPQPEPPPSGTYTIPGTTQTITITSDGTYFSWVSTLGIDAVIVKGGPNGNVYIYDPPAESFGDSGLHSPVNSSGEPAAISHIEFCYDFELGVTKTANTAYTRTYTWDITKTVDDASHVGFTGDSFVSNYDVSIDQTVTDSGFEVYGIITITNPSPFTVPFAISDTIGGNNVSLICPNPPSVAPGGTYVCSYSLSLASKTNGTNVVTVTSAHPDVAGGTDSAAFAFGDPTTIVGYPTVNVTDTIGGSLGSTSGDQTYEYAKTFTCDADEGIHPNTATIVETGQSDSASVTVDCYELVVTKDADTALTRTWDWTITKTGDQTDLTLSLGQQFLVNYTVVVGATSTDSDWAVSGDISVSNPAPIPATINSVSDVISGGINATVSCGVTFPYTLAAGSALNCTYAASLPDAADRTNTATATLQNTPSGTTNFTNTVNVSFSNAAVTEVDECITVSDDTYGPLGTVCASELPKTFSYSMYVGPYATCGDYTFVNVASFITNDTKATGSDDHTVNVSVPCLTGCTLTQGYWKTHSEKGPAPYDDTWAMLPNGADTVFYLSGQTWHQVFWTAPAGNAYYNLAHQFMAAYLNKLNGASTTPEVNAALAYANTFFNTYDPTDSLSKNVRKEALAMASILDNYNNGLIGPGHCSE